MRLKICDDTPCVEKARTMFALGLIILKVNTNLLEKKNRI